MLFIADQGIQAGPVLRLTLGFFLAGHNFSLTQVDRDVDILA